MSKKTKTGEGEVEKVYQKKTQLEHILLRPDSYIGTVEHISEKLWVIDEKTNTMVNREINYVPGLYKIFDEILVNAVDNITRDLRMNTIKVDITPKRVSIYNNGKGIPIKIHNTYKLYVPELIFGHLLTSSNYDDSEKKITGGRNGFGAKLTNVFSKLFIVETADKKVKKKYKIEFSDNMKKHKEAEIENYEGEDFTRVTFEPDFKKFKMTEFDNDIISLLKKRVYDVAGTSPTRINVYLNNKKIAVNNFKDYVDLYIKNKYFDEENKIEFPKLLANSTERWEVIFSMTDGTFQQVSFVNGICTSKGGTHVNYLMDQIIDRVSELIRKKSKDIKMNNNQIKQNIWIFLNCKIENPSFDSQTKETLTSRVKDFGSTCSLTEKFIKEFLKSNIVTNIIEFGRAKAKVKLTRALSSNIKRSSKLLGIDKLEDANLAGTKEFRNCTLIVTEGDSAKALAMSGIEVVGRDYFGCFPLRGKVLNVRGAKDTQIIKNEEIQNIIKILGLKIGMDYSEDLRGMRYGHLLIMTDQDFDGSHIKGLIINFIHFYWPSLIKRGDFLEEFITPIVKATKEGQEPKTFFTMKDYKNWYDNNNHNGFKIKYYKGLGTSTSKEAKEYFANIKKQRLKFKYINEEDDKSIELGFAKEESEARKQWLRNFDRFNTNLDQSKGEIRYKNFIDEELIFFSNYDNIRSIPSMIDGLKPSERKILFACFKRNLRNEIKVIQLSGYVAEVSAYHHGEVSLSQTITALAQDFVGSNNLNLLMPLGQFGSRYNGIKSAASPRYIFTNLNPITRKVFNEKDDNLLIYNVDEGLKIEPVWYVPIIPMVLVNGAEGIGTGWSTSVPEFNPVEVAENLIRKMNGETMKPLIPWYKGFTGNIKETTDLKGNKNFTVNGIININNDNQTVEISELPIHEFTKDYKTFLEKNHVDNKETTGKKDFTIEDIQQYHTDNKISFVLKLNGESFNEIKNKSQEDLIKLFKLSTTISTSNMVLFDSNNKIKKYETVEEILDEFYEVRLDYYKRRKKYLEAKLGFALEKNKNKKNFITMVLNNEIPFRTAKNKKEVLQSLKTKKLSSISELKKKYSAAFELLATEIVTAGNEENETNFDNNNNENNTNTENNTSNASDYDYLMNITMWSLTHEKVKELEEQIKKQIDEIKLLNSEKPEDLWKKDLEDFIDSYTKIVEQIDQKNNETQKKIEQMKDKSVLSKKYKKDKAKATIKKESVKKTKKKKDEDSFIDDDMNIEDGDYSVYSDSVSDSNSEADFDSDSDSSVSIEDKKKKKKTKKDNNGNEGESKKLTKSKKIIKKEKTKKKVNKSNSKPKPIKTMSLDEEDEDQNDEDFSYSIQKSENNNKKKNKSVSTAKKTKSKTNNKNKNVINDEDEENSYSLLDDRNDSISKDAKNIIKRLGVTKIDESKDPSKLSLKERIALRAKHGKIDSYFKSIENIKKNDNNIPDVEITSKRLSKDKDSTDSFIDEFLNKKKKPDNDNKSAIKKNDKKSAKKKQKIVEDEDFEI